MGQQEILDFLESRKDNNFYDKKQIRDGVEEMFGTRFNNSSITQCLRKLRKTNFVENKLMEDRGVKSPTNTYLYRKILE